MAPPSRCCLLLLLGLSLLLTTGCASLTNPVANGIPVRLLPDELLAEPKAPLKQVPLTWLRKSAEKSYRLAPGDVLGVFIDGVLGEPEQLPPVYYNELANAPPSIGFPIPVRENGTVPLPLIDPVKVEGLTLEEAEQKIFAAYTTGKEIVRTDEARALVTLISPRKAKILVIREDSPNLRLDNQNFDVFSRAAPIRGARSQGTGEVLELPATEADLLSVLARSGGLPGPNAANEVIIQRGYNDGNRGWPTDGSGNFCVPDAGWCRADETDEKGRPRLVRIPLRWRCEDAPPICPEDVVLESGDIVFVPAEEAQVYYTGGLLPAREVGLPRDTDLGVVEALLRVGGPLVNGGINANNLQGGIVGSGLGNPSPSLLTVLRRTEDGGQAVIRVDLNRALRDPRENLLVQAGDVLILQETPHESIARYFSSMFDLSLFLEILNSGSATITGSGVLP